MLMSLKVTTYISTYMYVVKYVMKKYTGLYFMKFMAKAVNCRLLLYSQDNGLTST